MVESRFEELERTCFVIMPFGTKEALGVQVDFDAVYHDVFSPAISEAVTPEHGALEPRRTDQDFFSGSINQEMFEYIVYSRLAFADISGLNPNVLYEIGVRHGVQAAIGNVGEIARKGMRNSRGAKDAPADIARHD